MEDGHLQNLIKKYLNGTATAFEEKQLNDWYHNANEKEVTWWWDNINEESEVESRMLKKLQLQVQNSETSFTLFYKTRLPKVAAVFTIFLLLIGYYFFREDISANNSARISAQAPLKFKENKYILLPDSSRVLLHSGSKMSYVFNGKTRDLILSGEAYFDVKHQKNPFIIHTGRIITTVLGTAFNIKAYPGQKVTVSVTRGKVSVGNVSGGTQAVLTPSQQVVYSEDTKRFHQQSVKVQQVINWTKSDMQFDDMPFKQLAERLARRYNVEVQFKNPELEKCLITGRFSGTESIEQVLQVLSETMGAFYKVSNNTITLDGKGCQ